MQIHLHSGSLHLFLVHAVVSTNVMTKYGTENSMVGLNAARGCGSLGPRQQGASWVQTSLQSTSQTETRPSLSHVVTPIHGIFGQRDDESDLYSSNGTVNGRRTLIGAVSPPCLEIYPASPCLHGKPLYHDFDCGCGTADFALFAPVPSPDSKNQDPQRKSPYKHNLFTATLARIWAREY